jgi:hypothetical protein
MKQKVLRRIAVLIKDLAGSNLKLKIGLKIERDQLKILKNRAKRII